MITIIDYGVGNVRSIMNTFDKIGYKTNLSNKEDDILSSNLLILPGVGAFPTAMDNLCNLNLIQVLDKYVQTGKTLLGICLGMQLLFDSSQEITYTKGLSYIKGDIVHFKDINAKIPHMGWNNLIYQNPQKPALTNDFVYFVHSYYAKTSDEYIKAYTLYDNVKIPAIVKNSNVYGMQFHPEKSAKIGQKLLLEILEEVHL